MLVSMTTSALHTPLSLWLDGRSAPTSAPALFDRLLLAPDDRAAAAAAEPNSLCVRDGRLEEAGRLLGAALSIGGPEDQSRALALVGSVEWLLIDAASASQPCIVAENLLAATDGTPTRLAFRVGDAALVPGLAFALERGVDALVCAEGDASGALLEALQVAKAQRLERADEADGSSSIAAASVSAAVELRHARVVGVSSGGMADRVCLDMTTLLSSDEGALIGSGAKELALVLGETVASGYVPPRPFRVNAGPVHAYVLMADGSTKYLSECRAGDEVLVANTKGRRRAAVVGRCKVEPRPTLRVDFALEGEDGGSSSIFLQQAETVRVATAPDGAPTPVTELQPGAEVLVRSTSRGTHVGRAIAARVAER